MTSPPDGALTGDGGAEGGIAGPTGRLYPDTTASIAILADQLPTMTAAQMQFATSHYVGTEKQLLPVTQALRALNPDFLVLHYHLAMWQSAPRPSSSDGMHGAWGNDYPTVTMNEGWFWHNPASERVREQRRRQAPDERLGRRASRSTGSSRSRTQVADGEYDGIMFDSASPALLQGECGGTARGRTRGSRAPRRRARRSRARQRTWIAAWQTWMRR